MQLNLFSTSGLEKEFDQRLMPDGKVNIDGFLVVFDVSLVPNRTLEKQVETTAQILNSLLKSKKPIVLATTKNDEGNEIFVREAERLLNRKEYKGIIPLVETSSHENINVDQAFFLGKNFNTVHFSTGCLKSSENLGRIYMQMNGFCCTPSTRCQKIYFIINLESFSLNLNI